MKIIIRWNFSLFISTFNSENFMKIEKEMTWQEFDRTTLKPLSLVLYLEDDRLR